MLKTLVFVGFVASALAEPVPEAAPGTSRLGLYDVYANCRKSCSPYANSPSESKKCIDTCIYYEQGSKKMEEKSVVSMRQARDVRQCINTNCAHLTLSPLNGPALYFDCKKKCRNQGKSLEDTPTADQLASVAVRESRGLEECIKGCQIQLYTPLIGVERYLDCVQRCRSQGKKMEEPLEKIAAEGQARGVKECKAKCTLLVVTPSFLPCLKNCDRLGKSLEAPLKTLPGPTGQARALTACVNECQEEFGSRNSAYYGCLMERCRRSGYGLDASEAFTSPNFASASAKPIDPEMLMQITEPIANILSQVIKRQQEMLQMINSCNCAKPFGQDNISFGNDVGPNF